MPASDKLNPFFKPGVKHSSASTSRTVGTGLDQIPAKPAQGPQQLHLRTSRRKPIVNLSPQEHMVNHSTLHSSSLIAVATGSSPLSSGRKRSRAAPLSSSDMSEHNDDEFSPGTHRRFSASSGVAKKQKKEAKKQMQTKRNSQDDLFVDDDDEEEEDDFVDHAANDFLPTNMIRKKAIHTDDNLLPLVMTRKKMPATPPSDAVTLYDSSSAGMLPFRKTPAKPVPQTLVIADEADRMMFTLKNQGKPWADILDKWEEITGVRPAASTLSVRYIKLNENLVANGYANKIHPHLYTIYPEKRYLSGLQEKRTDHKQQDLYLIQAKTKVDKALDAQRWASIAVEMKNLTGAKWTPKALKRRYDNIEDNDFLLGVGKNDSGEGASPRDFHMQDQNEDLDYDETEGNLAGLYENVSPEHTHPQRHYTHEPTPSKKGLRAGSILVDYGSDQD